MVCYAQDSNCEFYKELIRRTSEGECDSMRRKNRKARVALFSAGLLLALLLQGPLSYADEPAEEVTSTEELDWSEEDASQRQAVTSYASYSGLQERDGNLYLYDEDGTLRRDNAWVQYQGKFYFPNAEGVLYRDQMITFGPKVAYYMNHEGTISTGFQEINGRLMYFQENGMLDKSNAWVKTDRGWIFPNDQGIVYRDQFITFGPKVTFYMGHDGAYCTGFQEINDKLMYFGDNGVLDKSNAWVKTNRGWVFPNAQGELYRNRFITFGSNAKYFMGADGAMKTGMVEANGTVYDIADNGLVNTKPHSYVYQGKWYFAKEGGEPYRNQFISFGSIRYLMGEDGSRQTGIVPFNGTAYRFDEYGRLVQKSSSYAYNGNTYFSKPDGTPYRDQVLTFGSSYAMYMGEDGTKQYGLCAGRENAYYADTTTGNLLRNYGLFQLNNKIYHSGSSFALTRGWAEIDGSHYYFDKQAKFPAAFQNTVRTIDGLAYQFDEYGRASSDGTFSMSGEWTYANGYLQGPAVTNRYVGNNFAVVSLKHQYLWVFRGGKLAVSTPVISGKPSTPTVRGNFSVQGMTRGTYLTGPTWKSWVNYWVPFYAGYGLHDAPWQNRNNFYMDSQAYTWTGSHGCVNILPSVMPRVYEALYPGSAVTVY